MSAKNEPIWRYGLLTEDNYGCINIFHHSEFRFKEHNIKFLLEKHTSKLRAIEVLERDDNMGAFCDPVAVERERNALRQVVLDVLCDTDGKACFRGSDADRAATNL